MVAPGQPQAMHKYVVSLCLTKSVCRAGGSAGCSPCCLTSRLMSDEISQDRHTTSLSLPCPLSWLVLDFFPSCVTAVADKKMTWPFKTPSGTLTPGFEVEEE